MPPSACITFNTVPSCSLAKNVCVENASCPRRVSWKGTCSLVSLGLISNNGSSGIMDIIVLSVFALRRCLLAGRPVAKRASALRSSNLPAVIHARLSSRLKAHSEDPKSISQQFGVATVRRWSCVRPGLPSISCQRCVLREAAAEAARQGLYTHCLVISCIWRTLCTGQCLTMINIRAAVDTSQSKIGDVLECWEQVGLCSYGEGVTQPY